MRSEYLRSAHPAGPPVPKLRLLGTSWYRRGLGYWLRRTGLATGMTVITALMVFLLVGFVGGLASTTTGWGAVAVVVVASAAATWSTYSVFRSTLRREAEIATPPVQSAARRTRASGLGLGAAARGGSPVVGGLIFIGLLFVIGWLIVPTAFLFRRYLGPEEKAAVLAVQEWKAQHPEWRP